MEKEVSPSKPIIIWVVLMMQSTSKSVEQLFREKKDSGEKMLSVLIDPDKAQAASLNRLLDEVEDLADVFFIGGSLMTEDALDETLDRLKSRVDKPCILFPGSAIQVSRKADALLMLSLISGRNAELLIGQQVVARRGSRPSLEPFLWAISWMVGGHNSLVHQSIAAHTVGQTRSLPVPHSLAPCWE